VPADDGPDEHLHQARSDRTRAGSEVCASRAAARALRALKERFLADPVAFAEFCAGFQEAQNQEGMELRGRIVATRREYDRVTRGIG
jgi:hypothetical protein